MRYRITHTTHYRYSAPVELGPHLIRLCPRSDGAQWLHRFDLTVTSTAATSWAQADKTTADKTAAQAPIYYLDAAGNTCAQASFSAPLTALKVQTVSEVITRRSNPFDYLAEPWATCLPIDYSTSLRSQLQPYLPGGTGESLSDAIAPAVLELAQHIRQAVDDQVGYFLTHLVQYISREFTYQRRPLGKPYPAALTLHEGSGTCRDFAVLFIALCRSVGLAARFVSGYEQGDLDAVGEDSAHDLHAWAEVYVPGGGWRGFDPTLGLAVADRHIAIAVAPTPAQAAPVTGTLRTQAAVETVLEADISIESLTDLSA